MEMDPNHLVSVKATSEVDHSLDGESQSAYIVSVCAVACILSTAAVLARIYTRLCVLHTFGRDDFVMGVAQAFTLLTAAAIFVGEWVPSTKATTSFSKCILTHISFAQRPLMV